MIINLSFIEKENTKKTTDKANTLHIELCELDLTAILFDGETAVMVVNEKALKDLQDMLAYDKTDKKIKEYYEYIKKYLKK